MGRKTRIYFDFQKYDKHFATARSACKIKHENKASYNTDYIVPDLIDFFGDD